MSNLQLMHSALTQFVGIPIASINEINDILVFETCNGLNGFVDINYSGNMDVWVGEDVIYEIESELYDLIRFDRNNVSMMEFYEHLKMTDSAVFQTKSKQFFDIVKRSTENIIINQEVPLIGEGIIGHVQIYYTRDKKIKIFLN